MQLKKILKKGSEVETTWALTPEQEYFLLNFAINNLLERGLISVVEEEMGEEGESSFSLLEKLDVDKLPKA